MNRTITVRRDECGCIKAQPVYQYNRGHILRLEGFNLPEDWDLDLSNSLTGDAITVHGSGNTAQLPEALLQAGTSVYCWITCRNAAGRLTKDYFLIPVIRRAQLPAGQEQTSN